MKKVRLKYEQPRRLFRQELENIFLGGDGQEIGSALRSAFYSEDANWVLGWCLKFVGHREGIARKSAIQVLGNISVLGRSKVDLSVCHLVAEKLCDDPVEEVRIAAKDALEDIQHAITLKREA